MVGTERIRQMDKGSRNVLIICVTVMFCFILGATVAIVRLSTDGNQALGIITILFTNLGIVIAALATLIRSENVKGTVQTIQDNTDKILNGDMDAKIDARLEAHLPDIKETVASALIEHSVKNHPSR